MAAAATAASPSASFPAASLRRDARRLSCVFTPAAAATTAAEAGLAAVPPPPPTPMVRVVPESLKRESGCLVAGFRERGGAGADGEGFGDAAAGEGGGPGAMEYLTSVLSSKVYDVAIESPLQLATKLSDRLGVNLWIKREDLQPVIDGDARPPFVCLPPPPFFSWLAFVDVDICVLFNSEKQHHFVETLGFGCFSFYLCLWDRFALANDLCSVSYLGIWGFTLVLSCYAVHRVSAGCLDSQNHGDRYSDIPFNFPIWL